MVQERRRSPDTRRARAGRRRGGRLLGLVVRVGIRGGIGVGIAAMILLLGCGRDEGTPSPPAPDVAADAAATRAVAAERVVSLSRTATALMLELGLQSRIVAVDADSATFPGLERRLRIPDEEQAAFQSLRGLEADLVVLPASRVGLSKRLNAQNVRTVLVLIDDFDDGFTLWGELAGRLGLAERERGRIAEASRSLAELAAESDGFSRPRVAVVGSFDPLALVGDRQLATALVELAGGENVIRGPRAAAIPIDRQALKELAPELLVHASPEALDEDERRALAESMADVAPLVAVRFDPERFFAPEAVAAARALRAAIAPRARLLEAEPGDGATGAGEDENHAKGASAAGA